MSGRTLQDHIPDIKLLYTLVYSITFHSHSLQKEISYPKRFLPEAAQIAEAYIDFQLILYSRDISTSLWSSSGHVLI